MQEETGYDGERGPARLLRVYGWWVLLVTVAAMAAAFGLSHTAPVEHRAAAIVVVEARVRANTTPVAPDMGTEKELAQSGVGRRCTARDAQIEIGVEAVRLGGGICWTE